MATLFQIDYNINSNAQVSLANDIPVEVQRKTEFVPVTTAQDPLNINKETKIEEESLMNDDERKVVVDKIIANEALPFVEEDRETLNKFDDEKLNKVSALVPEVTTNEDEEEEEGTQTPEATPEVKKVETEVTTNQDDEASEKSDMKAIMEELKGIKESIPELVANAVKTEKESNEKAPIIAALLVNKQNVLTEDTLNAMAVEELRKYQAQVTPMMRFGAQGGNTEILQINADDDQPGPMPELEFEAEA